jgi:carnitine 3-dehydrogenase
VETHIRYLREVAAQEPVAVDTQVLGADDKRLHLFHTLVHGRTGDVLATGEHMLLHVDTAAGRTTPMAEPLAAGVSAAAAAHGHLPAPEGAGRAIGLAATRSTEPGSSASCRSSDG